MRTQSQEVTMLVVWTCLSAVGYVLATVAMKYWDSSPKIAIAALIVICLVSAVHFEIIALRGSALALTSVLIIGIETLLAFALGSALFGETYSKTTIAGAVLVLAGVALIYTAPTNTGA